MVDFPRRPSLSVYKARKLKDALRSLNVPSFQGLIEEIASSFGDRAYKAYEARSLLTFCAPFHSDHAPLTILYDFSHIPFKAEHLRIDPIEPTHLNQRNEKLELIDPEQLAQREALARRMKSDEPLSVKNNALIQAPAPAISPPTPKEVKKRSKPIEPSLTFKKESKTVVSFALEQKYIDELNRIADMDDRSVSSLLRRAVRLMLDRNL